MMDFQDIQEQNVSGKESDRIKKGEINGLFFRRYDPISTFIQQIEYSYGIHKGEKVSELIIVRFFDGGMREYKGGEEEWILFSAAISVGKHWHKNYKGQKNEKRIR